MSKVLELKIKDKTGQIKNTGKIEIKNQTEDKAELYFYGDIVSETWQSYWFEEDKCPQDVSDFLKELENSKDVDIYINSGGGSVFAGIAIYSMLKRHKGKKIVHVDGLAASIASVIALAGDEVIIPSYANFMIHNPLCFLFDSYNAKKLREVADCLDSCKENILNIYLANAKNDVTKEELSKLMDNETWMTGEEASKYFNITVEENIEAVACASNLFNKYNNVPKNILNNNKRSAVIDNTKIIKDPEIEALIKRINLKFEGE
ncbi:head maturation protease, ClpP-related [Clostridium haemolyticum]|uniref:ATP-dependent Clp protease proteolytic subunit n=1 Tax=Clostridium haemolyticum NCTC 9693 TaxID=1443114 RepID=A0ABR4TGT0_CLOHA|nr:head maturation protease, ClpP-related [Clostridium haemolyticum]KEI18210.1 Clp protease [Clostridium haemolyticum NCTC 9693]KGN02914.1 Clp protease [Clostridium haemolyticum NCTC 8350]